MFFKIRFKTAQHNSSENAAKPKRNIQSLVYYSIYHCQCFCIVLIWSFEYFFTHMHGAAAAVLKNIRSSCEPSNLSEISFCSFMKWQQRKLHLSVW